MNFLKFNKKNINKEINIDIGDCVKMKNSKKVFQIIGLNEIKTICWVRELPLNYQFYKTFEVSMSQINMATKCPNNYIKNDFNK